MDECPSIPRRRLGNHFDALTRHSTCPRVRPHRPDRPRFPLTPRRAPILAATFALFVVAACATSSVAPSTRNRRGPPSPRHPRPTPIVTPSRRAPATAVAHAAAGRGQRRRQRLPRAHGRDDRPLDPPGHARGPVRQGLAARHRGQRRPRVRPPRDRGRDERHRTRDHRARDPRQRGRRRDGPVRLRRRHGGRGRLPRDAPRVHRLRRVPAAAQRQRPVPGPAVGRGRGRARSRSPAARPAGRASRSSSARGRPPTPSPGPPDCPAA